MHTQPLAAKVCIDLHASSKIENDNQFIACRKFGDSLLLAVQDVFGGLFGLLVSRGSAYRGTGRPRRTLSRTCWALPMRGRRPRTRSRMRPRCLRGTSCSRQGDREEWTRKHRVVGWFKGSSHAAELLSHPTTALHHLLQKKEMKHREQVTKLD